MKFKKVICVLSMVLSLASFSNVYAVDIDGYNLKNLLIYKTRMLNTENIDTFVKKSGKKIKAVAFIDAKNNARVEGRIYLQKYKNSKWQTAKSWIVEGLGSVRLSKVYRELRKNIG